MATLHITSLSGGGLTIYSRRTHRRRRAMSTHDQALASILSQVALSFDGAVLGVVLAYAAVRSLLKFASSSSALRKLRDAPSVRVADLRSALLDDDDESISNCSDEGKGKVVIVRGHVEAKSAVCGNSWKGFKENAIVAQESGEKGVVVQRTQTCIYNEWKGLLGWTSDLRALLTRSWRQEESKLLRTIPFVLVEGGQWPNTEYVVVNVDGSSHPLPLSTVYHQLQPIKASPYTFLQALFGHEYPIGLLDEEKILPIGKAVSAVGLCRFQHGVPEIKSCKDLPYFLSEMTKDQMVIDLTFKTKVLLWSGVTLGSISIGILGFAVMRNWNRWKERRQQRQSRQQNPADSSDVDERILTDEEAGDISDGQLCVICLMRRRRSAFIPCGHLVCCRRCAVSVEHEDSPKCPVCRQAIRNSVRIYDS